jgi:hypothetical protein
MTTTAETRKTEAKQVPDFYIFENGADGTKGGKPAGAAFVHKKGNGFTMLIGANATRPSRPKRRRQHSRHSQSSQPREKARNALSSSITSTEGKKTYD